MPHPNPADCPCPRTCKRHGDCAACEQFHQGQKDPVWCERSQPKQSGKCYLLGGGPLEGCDGIKISPEPQDLVIACDAGYLAAQKLGLTPGLVVGDFDSYSGEIAPGIETYTTPVRKNDTDTITGARMGLARGYREFILIGALGGRLDHTVANLQTLCFLCGEGARGEILSAENRAWAVKDGTLTLPRMEGWHLSVFAADGVCTGVTLRGVSYPLEDYTLTPAFPLGVSNEFDAEQAQITVAHGTLLVIASSL